MAAEQLPAVVISAANFLYPIPAAAIKAKMASARVKMMAMQEYPRLFVGISGDASAPKGSNASILARNIDCEVSQWRRALRVIRGMA